MYMTSQAPHAIRTVVALIAGHLGLFEHKIRVISPDLGGGFGGKVPVYPGYVCAIAASVVTGKPIKWIEDRSENLQADSFGRDYHIKASVAAKKDGNTHFRQDEDHRRSRVQRRCGTADEVSRRPLSHLHGFLRLQERFRGGRRCLYQQATRRHRLSVLLPSNRGSPRHRAYDRHHGP